MGYNDHIFFSMRGKTVRYWILILVFFVTFAYARDDLNTMRAKIFPQILLVDLDLDTKKIDNKLIFTIVTDNMAEANDFISAVRRFYGDEIKGIPLELSIKPCNQISSSTPMSALYLMNDECPTTDAILAIAQKKRIVSFVGSSTMLDRGGTIALDFGPKVHPVLHSRDIRSGRYRFAPGFLAVARIIND